MTGRGIPWLSDQPSRYGTSQPVVMVKGVKLQLSRLGRQRRSISLLVELDGLKVEKFAPRFVDGFAFSL